MAFSQQIDIGKIVILKRPQRASYWFTDEEKKEKKHISIQHLNYNWTTLIKSRQM